ncbi:tetratricopeptide repeat-containing protein [Streptomyces flavofungini]|uniref:tetratricopeptide repeat-containing protein n=1 Tax=Streptomyces flavofungini TaxID=68200 RepID=UPI0025AF747A|nr:tetratricopeptide repeat-containing protein [Streptomyces flavofungini]WJV44295.1 tetratricopeptide repeat-containing protein [Streptomyces flavofungini]
MSTRRLPDLVWAHLDGASGWVLVFDNVDAPEEQTAPGVPIRDGDGVIRGSLSGLVLVTSRQAGPLVRGDGAVLHAVEPLTDADGARVLLDDADVFGEHHADTLRSRNNLAEVLYAQGEWRESEAEHRATLRIRQEAPRPLDLDTLTSPSNHAAILLDQGRVDEARAENEAVLVARCRALGPDHPQVATSRRNLARAQRRRAGCRDVEAADVTGY